MNLRCHILHFFSYHSFSTDQISFPLLFHFCFWQYKFRHFCQIHPTILSNEWRRFNRGGSNKQQEWKGISGKILKKGVCGENYYIQGLRFSIRSRFNCTKTVHPNAFHIGWDGLFIHIYLYHPAMYNLIYSILIAANPI